MSQCTLLTTLTKQTSKTISVLPLSNSSCLFFKEDDLAQGYSHAAILQTCINRTHQMVGQVVASAHSKCHEKKKTKQTKIYTNSIIWHCISADFRSAFKTHQAFNPLNLTGPGLGQWGFFPFIPFFGVQFSITMVTGYTMWKHYILCRCILLQKHRRSGTRLTQV